MQAPKINTPTLIKEHHQTKKQKVYSNVLTKQIYKSRYSATNPYVHETNDQWTKCTQKRKKALLSTLSLKEKNNDIAHDIERTPQRIRNQSGRNILNTQTKNSQKTKSIPNIPAHPLYKFAIQCHEPLCPRT